MKRLPFTGSGTALITPFNYDGSIDFKRLEELIAFQIENGTDAIIVCGTTAENATLTDEERKSLIRFCVKAVDKRIPVIAGTGSNNTQHAVELTKYAAKEGADAVLAVTPYYNKASKEGLTRHFFAVADCSDLPVILYNVPSRTGMNISIDTYKRLAEHVNIVATKEASGDISAIAQIADECGGALHIYSGNDDQTVPILALGGKGVISVLSNIMPRETHDVCGLWFEGRQELSLSLFLRLLEITNNLFIDVNPIPVKAALRLMGKDLGVYRLPLCEMDEEKLERLRSSMTKLGLID